ncbi:hypothetical protein K474DRAFT_1603752 [Panus rudis PR-1116 ss-1]|nr:hypothetical protein K474DRAFT_1603752 [Panus rudis PR-1116 ss-1]
MPSPASNVNEGKSLSGAVIAKRRRICPGPSGVKPTGACTRCKRLKMKCTFPDEENACSRCTTGNHECVVLGRKPRSPGMREVLQKQIREKDSMIDNLLQQINPTPSLATPLSIVPSRLALTEAQREQYRDVLSWFEKAQSGVKGDLREKIDVSPLEEGYEEGADSDDEGSQDSNCPDACAAALARQLRFLPGESAPAGLLVSAVLDSTKKKQSTEQTSARQDDDDNQDLRIEAGIGSKNYFQPAGPSANLDLRRLIIERQAAPEILLSGLVTYDDVPILFQLYFKWINPVIPVLDENIHTPAAVLSRCPFLFTVVCALASRYYNEKPDMYALAIHIAKASAANAFLDGWKTIEMCQAYILMGAYTPPARKWEEDRYWFFTGIAFRLGIELNLSRVPPVKPANERDERELLNRTRTWIICYIMDRCICVNLGKPFMVPEDDTIRNIEQKFLGSKYQHPGDGYLVSLVELLRIITRFSETTNPILAARQDPSVSDAELYILHKSIDDELKTWFNVADERCRDDGEPHDQGHVLQMALMHSVYQYCRLVIYSYGLQHVMKRGSLEVDSLFFVGCLQSASAVLNLFMDGLIPTGFIGNCPEQILALTAFATAILLKFLRPEYSEKLDQLQEDRIIELIQRLLNVLNAESENDAEDDQRITKRYARFVQHILGPHIAQLKKRRELSRSAASVRELPASGASFLSATSAQSELPSAPVDTSLNQPPLSEKEELPAIIVSPMWEDIFSGPNSAPMPPLTGFSDTDFLAAMMSFPDQSWMGVVDLA